MLWFPSRADYELLKTLLQLISVIGFCVGQLHLFMRDVVHGSQIVGYFINLFPYQMGSDPLGLSNPSKYFKTTVLTEITSLISCYRSVLFSLCCFNSFLKRSAALALVLHLIFPKHFRFLHIMPSFGSLWIKRSTSSDTHSSLTTKLTKQQVLQVASIRRRNCKETRLQRNTIKRTHKLLFPKYTRNQTNTKQFCS